jgi:hypothetical protein
MDYLGNKLGKTGTSLSYVIQADDAVPDAAVDLLTAIAMTHEKAIKSTNFDRPSYEADNGHMWGWLLELCEGGTVWSFIFKSSMARNGCGAYKAPVVHYKGAEHISHAPSRIYM